MKAPRYIRFALSVVAMPLWLSACGGGSGPGPSPGPDSGGDDAGSGDPQLPADPSSTFTIVERSPAADAFNRALVGDVQVTFNKALVPDSVNSDSILLEVDGNGVAATVTYTDGDSHVVVSPDSALQPDSEYTVVITPELMAHDGETLARQTWSFMTAGDIGSTAQSVIDECMSDADIEMLVAVNVARSEARLCGASSMPQVPSLAWSCAIEEAALGHSQDMSDNDFFSHTGSSGSSMSERISATGYRFSAAAENIAVGYRSIADVMTGWIDSPGHCANIMSASVTEFGASEVDTYWTQNFARPR